MSSLAPAVEHDPGRELRSASGIPIVPALDGIRGVAVLGVIAFHVIGASGLTERLGGSAGGQFIYGVLPQLLNLLFMVSGFVMFLPAAARTGDLGSIRAYAIRRVARLAPAFYVSLLITYAILAIVNVTTSRGALMPGADSILAHLLFVHVPYAVITDQGLVGFSVNGPVWTLSVEATFYVLLPLVAMAFFRRPALGVAIAAAAWWVWATGFDDTAAWENEFPFWVYSFAVGMAVARAFVVLDRHGLARVARVAAFVSIGSLLVLAVLARTAGVGTYAAFAVLPFSFAHADPALQFAITTLLGVWMLATISAPAWLQRPLSNPLARWLGDISFGAYLIHFLLLFPIAVYLDPITDGSATAVAVWTALVLPLSITYGWASRTFVELPIRRRAQVVAKRLQAQHRQRAAVAAEAG